MIDNQTRLAIGTKLYIVPIRFWETQEPETCTVVQHSETGSTAHERDEKFAYVFHDGYGHNVYVKTVDLFDTCEGAVEEALRRKAEKEAQEEREMDALMARIFPGRRA